MIDHKDLRHRVLRYEERYPLFRFCETFEDVAETYGWGTGVSDAWSDYMEARFILDQEREPA